MAYRDSLKLIILVYRMFASRVVNLTEYFLELAPTTTNASPDPKRKKSRFRFAPEFRVFSKPEKKISY